MALGEENGEENVPGPDFAMPIRRWLKTYLDKCSLLCYADFRGPIRSARLLMTAGFRSLAI